MMLLAFEVQDGVDDVLEHLRPGQAAVFRHVADEHRRQVPALRGEQQIGRGLPHLADAAGRRLHLERKDRLNRIDDEQRRLHAIDLLDQPLDARLGQQVERRAADAEALAAQLDLVLRFFARAVEDGADIRRDVRRGLEQQRGLADAGLAAEQHERSWHDAAAEHTIELADPGRHPLGHDGVDLVVQPRSAAAQRRRRAATLDRRGRELFDERVPLAAVGTLAEPLLGLGAAG